MKPVNIILWWRGAVNHNTVIYYWWSGAYCVDQWCDTIVRCICVEWFARLPYNLYCVDGDIKHCSIQSNEWFEMIRWYWTTSRCLVWSRTSIHTLQITLTLWCRSVNAWSVRAKHSPTTPTLIRWRKNERRELILRIATTVSVEWLVDSWYHWMTVRTVLISLFTSKMTSLAFYWSRLSCFSMCYTHHL